MSLQRIANAQETLRWIHVVRPSEKDRAAVAAINPFDSIDLLDAFRPTLHSKITLRENYIFLVLMVPHFEQKTHSVQIAEIDLFIGKDYLVSVSLEAITLVEELFEAIERDPVMKERHFKHGIEHLLVRIIGGILDSVYPIIDTVDVDMQRIKDETFSGKHSRKNLVEETLQVRNNIIDTRKALRGHSNILSTLKLGSKGTPSVDFVAMRKHIDVLIEDSHEIWAALESNIESIEALKDANDQLVTHNLNSIIRTLTAFSAILLPSAVIASIFGMNTVNPPILGHQYDFWLLLGIMGVLTAVMLVIFYRKHWIR